MYKEYLYKRWRELDLQLQIAEAEEITEILEELASISKYLETH
jgi:hypothetical protein